LGNVVKVGDYLYGTPGASLTCAEFKTGTTKWQERSKSLSFLDVDGRLYTHAEDGYVALVEPSPEAYREKTRFIPPNRPVKWVILFFRYRSDFEAERNHHAPRHHQPHPSQHQGKLSLRRRVREARQQWRGGWIERTQ